MVSHTPKPKHHQQNFQTVHRIYTVHKYNSIWVEAYIDHCACVVSYLPSPSPSPWTKILIDGLLNRVELRRAERNRVLLFFIDSGPGHQTSQLTHRRVNWSSEESAELGPSTLKRNIYVKYLYIFRLGYIFLCYCEYARLWLKTIKFTVSDFNNLMFLGLNENRITRYSNCHCCPYKWI